MTSQVNRFSWYAVITYIPWIMISSIIVVLIVFVYPIVTHNIETRENNFKLIDSSTSCSQLESNYLNAMDFETGFSDNGESVKVTAHEHVKALELSCK